MTSLGLDDFWEMKSDQQENPNEVDPLEEALLAISSSYIQILRLSREKLGSYIEIAYEWSWDEAMSMIEVLDVREESQERDRIKSAAEQTAVR